MKITHVAMYFIAAIFWTAFCLFQLLLPVTLYAGFTCHPAFFGIFCVVAILCIPLTLFWGGFNTVPSLFWRFRRNLDTRIVEVNGHFAAQVRLIGNKWLFIDATPGDVLITCWEPEMCAYNILLKNKRDAENYLDQLAKDVHRGLKFAEPAPEILTNYQIIDGERVKK
ncbi:hypothetical protein D3C80_949790 [compost metagenome]